MTIRVSLEKFSGELKEYAEKDIEKYKKSVIDALLKNLQTVVKSSPIDTGLYAQSWDLIIEEKQALLGNYAPHAPIIEFGARPFRPPLKPLLDWARRVLNKPEFDEHVWALAKYTQGKIEREGMKPRHILTNALDLILNDIRINLRKNFT
jgi:hypothetical protein